jgi:hypothetical protein
MCHRRIIGAMARGAQASRQQSGSVPGAHTPGSSQTPSPWRLSVGQELVLVDADGPVTEIDHDVLGTWSKAPLVDDTVVYRVRDAQHERTGVWIAQIAPIAEP